ncbi:MAG: polyprenol phosphomannose-dependent alpha 1,6 mannosyltransferase MptB [Ardenticatenaceae bacterium]|nr:polyprenol phosphomannose-dependent alpha 1,6 mannosyltransferase MptB [Ardenticatenaceae bacterium]
MEDKITSHKLQLAFFQRPPLWALILLMALGYGLMAVWFPLHPHVNQVPLADIRTFTPSLAAGGAYALLLLALFGLYALAARRAANLSLTQLLLITLLFSLPLLFTYPINATDIYRYFLRGRVSSVYGESPYAAPPNQFSDDPYLPFGGEWADQTSPYGPLWEMTAAGITAVAPDNLYLSLLLFKGLGLLLHLAATVLIWKVTGYRQVTSESAILWAWNPALLLTFVVDAHNDILMLCLLLLGYWVMQRKHLTAGFLLMALAPLAKPIGLLPLPFFWLASWREQKGRARWAYTAVTILGSILLAWLAFLPFGSPLELAQRLLYEASDVGGFSIPVLIILGLREVGQNPSIPLVINLARGVFVGTAVWLAWQTMRGKLPPHRSAAVIFLAYIFTAFSFRIWYTTWAFPWLLLAQNQARRRMGITLLLTAQLSVLIYGHLRVYALGGSQTLAHLIGVPFTLGLPLLWNMKRDA